MHRDETVPNFHLTSIAWMWLSAFLWLLLPAHAQHPRILFSPADIPDIRVKARGTHAAVMRPIISKADALLDDPVPVYPNAPSSSTSRWGGDLSVLAFAHVATGDSRYGEKAREHLLEFATWPAWGLDREVGDRDLGLAYLIRGNALAYDWLFDSLSTQDRTTIRTSLTQHAQEMYEAASLEIRSEWRNWWIKSYGQNHWDINNTSLGMAALALEGEDQRAGQWLEHVIAEIRKDSSNLDNIIDGTWHEGCLYQQSKLVYTMAFYYSLKRLKDIDLFPRRYLRNYALLALYNYLPGNRQVALTYSSYRRNWGGWLSAGGYSPIKGTIQQCQRIEGHFHSLKHRDSLVENERVFISILGPTIRIGCVLIASRLVRRIISFVKTGETVERGARIGAIRFGSQVDVLIPDVMDMNIAVVPGQRIQAGSSIFKI